MKKTLFLKRNGGGLRYGITFSVIEIEQGALLALAFSQSARI